MTYSLPSHFYETQTGSNTVPKVLPPLHDLQDLGLRATNSQAGEVMERNV